MHISPLVPSANLEFFTELFVQENLTILSSFDTLPSPTTLIKSRPGPGHMNFYFGYFTWPSIHLLTSNYAQFYLHTKIKPKSTPGPHVIYIIVG